MTSLQIQSMFINESEYVDGKIAVERVAATWYDKVGGDLELLIIEVYSIVAGLITIK